MYLVDASTTAARASSLNTISGVDLALWDLLGKAAAGAGATSLLGGPVRDELDFYATGARPDLAKELGFIGGKMPLQHGPAEGEEGLQQEHRDARATCASASATTSG